MDRNLKRGRPNKSYKTQDEMGRCFSSESPSEASKRKADTETENQDKVQTIIIKKSYL